jgi:hypothetical protein
MPRHIDFQLIAAVADCRDRGLGEEPEHLGRPVVGEHQRQGVVIDPGSGSRVHM